MEGAIANEVSAHFERAESTIIWQEALLEILRYVTDTRAATDILEGTFKLPKDTSPATLIILKEIASVWKKMGEGGISITVSKDDFRYCWKCVR